MKGGMAAPSRLREKLPLKLACVKTRRKTKTRISTWLEAGY
jgi:hypothetical protein